MPGSYSKNSLRLLKYRASCEISANEFTSAFAALLTEFIELITTENAEIVMVSV